MGQIDPTTYVLSCLHGSTAEPCGRLLMHREGGQSLPLLKFSDVLVHVKSVPQLTQSRQRQNQTPELESADSQLQPSCTITTW